MARRSADDTDSSIAPPPDAGVRFLILCGKERFLQDQYLRSLREALIAKHGADGVDTVRFDGNQGSRIAGDVLDELRSFGLMQQHKIVLVDNAENMLKEADSDAPPAPKGKRRAPAPLTARELFEKYTEDASSSATLVFKAGTWRSGNLDKAVDAMPKGTGRVIKCEPWGPDVLRRWALKRAKVRHNTSIDDEALSMLLSAVGSDLGRIANEIEKLAVAAGGDGQPITADLVQNMVGMTREEEFWSLQGELVAGDAPSALTQLRNLMEVSRHDPVPLTFTCSEMARKVHAAARGVADGTPQGKIMGALRMWGPAERMVDGVFATARAAGPAGAFELLRAAAATDAANKSGLGEPARNVERLVLRFVQTRAAPPTRRTSR